VILIMMAIVTNLDKYPNILMIHRLLGFNWVLILTEKLPITKHTQLTPRNISLMMTRFDDTSTFWIQLGADIDGEVTDDEAVSSSATSPSMSAPI